MEIGEGRRKVARKSSQGEAPETTQTQAAMYDEVMAESFSGEPGAATCGLCGKPGDDEKPLKAWVDPRNDTRWFYHYACLWDEVERDELEDARLNLVGPPYVIVDDLKQSSLGQEVECWGCEKSVTLEFFRVYTSDKRHWIGFCQCGTRNYVHRPDWDLAEEVGRHFEPVKLGIELGKPGGKLSQPVPSGPGTQEVISAYLTHMEDEGAAEGYLTVRARKLRFFARQYPLLPYAPEIIHTYLRQFKTADVPTRQDQWKALSALYKFASGTYRVPNVMLQVDKPRFRKKPGQRVSRDQARSLVTSVKTDLEWALVTCYFGLRFRRVEAERLQLGDVKEDYLIVRGKARTEELPLLPLFRDKLLRFDRGQRLGDPLFPIKGDDMAYHIKKIFRRAGITDIRTSPHTLRNTAGRLWLTYGGDDRANRQLLRHSNRTMTDHYSALNIDELYALDERFNPMLNLMRELDLAPVAPQFKLIKPLTNTTGVRETEAKSQTEDITSLITAPSQQLPDLIDQMISLGEMARELKHALGGNGHWPEQNGEIIRFLEHQAKK